jgi:phosphoribosylformimino-5-aminoimidazole carboxamide ribotide isomerase
VAGGIRTAERAEYWIDKGAGRVVFGTAAVSQPTMVKHVAQMHADQIVVAVDIYQGKLLTDGWRKESMYEPQDFMHSFADVPLAAFLVTDVGADKAEIEVGASEIAALVSSTRQSVIGSGLVRTIDDISVLKYAGHCDGVLVGRALFNKTVDLSEALRVAAPQKERTAAFV